MPLNALAEDQIARLRVALDGDDVRDWLRARRSGNRFWFGRYTGWTPIPGRADRDGAEAELRTELSRIAKETLRRAFSELSLFATGSGDSVHGEFGAAAAWGQPPANPPVGYNGVTVADIVQEWIDRNGAVIERVCDSLLVSTRLAGDAAERAAAIAWIANDLTPEVTRTAQDPTLVQDGLSERLANSGILPMFGYPTRARLLYHSTPRNWPPRQVVDRDLELAVSMFAPGAETVKERTIHTAIGVGHYRRQGQFAVEDDDPLGPSVHIGLCGNCQHVETAAPQSGRCPVCSAAAGTGERDFQAMDLRQPMRPISARRLSCKIS